MTPHRLSPARSAIAIAAPLAAVMIAPAAGSAQVFGDGDGDGVADAADLCPALIGATVSGCLPSETIASLSTRNGASASPARSRRSRRASRTAP